MGFNCGIVGLPNVGKSTLFNALTQTQAAEAANYPFCTIEPNKGRVAVIDERLDKLSLVIPSEKKIPTQIEFVDIAGLVKGASKGEGLGNQFLSHIREVDAIIHLLRCFKDDNVTHVEGDVNPIRDAEIIDLELVMADLDSIEKRLPNLEKKAKQSKELQAEVDLLKRVADILKTGKPARSMLGDVDKKELAKLQLITSKPVLYVCNVGEDEVVSGNQYVEMVRKRAEFEKAECVLISAKIEAEISALESEDEKKEFLESIGLSETGLSRLIKAGQHLLGLINFFTVGPKEARAWDVPRGALAPQAAGAIHTDFEKGFIRAETIAYEDYIKHNGEAGCRELGKLRSEGKDYVVADGDVMHFRFNV